MTEPTSPLSLSEYAERALLGVLAHDPARVAELGPEFTQHYFGDARNAALFQALRTDLASQASRLRQQHADVAGTSQWAQVLLDAAPGLRAAGVDAGYLTAVMALAPPGSGQPEVYSHLIVEASIRRELTSAGLQVGQASTATPALADMLAVIDTAFDQVSAAQHRWEQITETRSLTHALNTDPGTTPASSRAPEVHTRQPAPPPSEADLLAAQESVVGGVLRFPEFAGQVLGRLEPADFTDPELTTTIRAAADVHAEATTGWRVDPVTVAWAQQRHAAEHGAGAPPHRLHALTAAADPAQLDTALDLVMRGSLARLSAQAAEQAQQLAQRADLTPEQLLAGTRDTYAAVQTAAIRMTGPAGTAHQLAMHAHRSTPTRVDSAPTTGNLTALREHTAGLLNLLDPPADNAHHPNAGSALSARLALDHTAEATLDQEVTPDAGPEL